MKSGEIYSHEDGSNTLFITKVKERTFHYTQDCELHEAPTWNYLVYYKPYLLYLTDIFS